MLKVKLTFRQLDLQKTIEQKKEVYTTSFGKYLVASTKSFNNLIDDLKAENMTPTKTEVRELFIDKSAMESKVASAVDELVSDEEYKWSVVAHIMKALDSACVFEKPPIVRKKA